MFEATKCDGVLRLHRPETRWLSTGWDGGMSRADVAYNISVPEGWDSETLHEYVTDRRQRAGFDSSGPALLTGVDLDHARGARSGSVEVYATAGVSNPAALPMEPESTSADSRERDQPVQEQTDFGTVNIMLGTTKALADGALANLVAVAAEAKTATLLARTGFPGTTTDAIVAACDPAGESVEFSGSGTAVGTATRACVREAVTASLASRYPAGGFPTSVEAAEYGTTTDSVAEVFEI